MWKSSAELDTEIESLSNLHQLSRLYALSFFWKSCVFCDGYKASDELTSVLKFTEAGREEFSRLSPSLADLAPADVTLAWFMKFFHHDLFFSHEGSDGERISAILERELLQERVRLPHRFGRALYDRFNDTYMDSRTDHLMSQDVQRLLEGSPIGVYQLGDLISGPLGVVKSEEMRYIPPILDLPLWHCSDTGCNALHDVTLVGPTVPILEARSRIKKELFDREGPAAEWEETLFALLHREGPRYFIDLPVMIADCIVGEDLTVLVEEALRGPKATLLRNTLASPPRRKREAEGPASDVASRLVPEARLQILLVLSDKDLVTLIDHAVSSRAVKIPLGETRKISYSTPRHSSDSDSQLSRLGIRSVRWDPVVNLTRAVWRAYQLLSLGNELEWHVRVDGAKSPYEALVEFIRNRGPAESARELILSSARVTEVVCEDLQIPLSYARGTDNETVDRLLWKLGFNPMQFDVATAWDNLGTNPLGTLLRYLRAAADWIQSLPGKDRAVLKRAERDLPHFADSDYLKFPFRHTSLWADSELTELQRYSELFARLVKLVEESDPANVRNGLDHFRDADQFPSADKLLACVARLWQALELADVQRFLPKVHWLFGRKGNRFGVVENEFRDYAGRPTLIYGPLLASGLRVFSYEDACVLAPGNLLGSPNASLMFLLREPSEYSKYWEDYPKRRRIPPSSNGSQVAPQEKVQGSADLAKTPGDGNGGQV